MAALRSLVLQELTVQDPTSGPASESSGKLQKSTQLSFFFFSVLYTTCSCSEQTVEMGSVWFVKGLLSKNDKKWIVLFIHASILQAYTSSQLLY